MTANNVVTFPKAYSGPKDQVTLEDISKNLDMMKQFHIQETLTNIAPMIFNQLDISGFTLSDPDSEEFENIKDGALIIESLRSIMSKHYGIYHPFQKLSEEIFYPDDKDPDMLKIVDSIKIDLKNIEE